jgi:hypothetical protein
MSFGIVLAGTALAGLYVLRRLRFDWFIVAMVLAGTVLCVDYLTYTEVAERNYDGPAHVAYAQSIALHLQLPDVFACAACGHPPLASALGALWSKVVLVGGWMPLELGLQWLSLLLFLGFVVFALLILRSCDPRPATLRLAAALVVFWPSSIINSVRVHNDALASLLMLAAMYFIARWDAHGRSRDFHAALAASALALLTKSTGYAVAATLLLFAALRLRSTGPKRESVDMETLGGFPCLPAFWLRRAKPGYAIATRHGAPAWTVAGARARHGRGRRLWGGRRRCRRRTRCRSGRANTGSRRRGRPTTATPGRAGGTRRRFRLRCVRPVPLRRLPAGRLFGLGPRHAHRHRHHLLRSGRWTVRP